MGQSQSSNITDITSNIVSSEVSTILQQTDTKAGSSQLIECVGGKGECDIEGNSQDSEMTVNMSAVANQMSTQKSQQTLVQKLSQAAAATTSGINFGNSSNTQNTLNDTLKATLTVASNLGQICAASSSQSQVIRADSRDGKVVIKDNQQKAVASVVGNCIQKATATNTALQDAQTEISQMAKSKTEGFDFMWLVILAAIVAFVFIAGPAAAISSAASGTVKMVTALMGLIMIAGGSVCIWWWSTHRGSTTDRAMKGTQFSTLIKNNPLCGGVAYLPTNSPSSAPQSGDPLQDAGAVCLQDPLCQGFDWDTSKTPPQVTYYKSINTSVQTGTCQSVQTQNLEKAGIDLVREPVLITGSTDPTATSPADGKQGDVYINMSTGRMFWRKDKTKNPWGDVTDGQTFPGWKAGITIRSGGQTQPLNTTGADGDIYINTSDPNKWEIWKRYSGKYAPLNSDDAGQLLVGPNGGTALTTKYATNNTLSFPGRAADTQPANKYNWTVYVGQSSTQKEGYFFLVIGIILILVGLVMIVIKFLQKPPQPVSTMQNEIEMSDMSSEASG
jgi:hypothetical protein